MKLNLSCLQGIPSGKRRFTIEWYSNDMLINLLEQKQSAGINYKKPQKIRRLLATLTKREMVQILEFHKHPRFKQQTGRLELIGLLTNTKPRHCKNKFATFTGSRSLVDAVERRLNVIGRYKKPLNRSIPEISHHEIGYPETRKTHCPSYLKQNIFDDFEIVWDPIQFQKTKPANSPTLQSIPKLRLNGNSNCNLLLPCVDTIIETLLS